MLRADALSSKCMRMIGHGVAVSFLIAGCVGSREPKVRPSGQEATRKTEALKFGAKLLQKDSPLDPINVYLVGFHPIKSDPGRSGPLNGSTPLL